MCSQLMHRSKIGFAPINTNIVWQRSMSAGDGKVNFKKMDAASVANMLKQLNIHPATFSTQKTDIILIYYRACLMLHVHTAHKQANWEFFVI